MVCSALIFLPVMAHHDPDGFKSRKMWVCVGGAVLVFIAWLLTAAMPSLRPSLETVVGAIVALVGGYLTGNIMGKKHMPQVPAAPLSEPPKKLPPEDQQDPEQVG